MPAGLHRTYGAHHLHFITCSCYQRLPFLGAARSRDCFVSILEQTRQRYRFVVVGYVAIPEHIHLLITEPEIGTPSTVMQVLKQRTAHALLPKRKRRDPRQCSLFPDELRRAFWQARFYDFNVWTTKKRVEKLRYMHRNPVKRADWSSRRNSGVGVATGFTCSGSAVQYGSTKVGGRFRLGIGPLKTVSTSVRGYPPLQKAQERGTHSRGGVGNSKPGPPVELIAEWGLSILAAGLIVAGGWPHLFPAPGIGERPVCPRISRPPFYYSAIALSENSVPLSQ
jgi:putative transposase